MLACPSEIRMATALDTVEADSEETLDMIRNMLKAKGFLVEEKKQAAE